MPSSISPLKQRYWIHHLRNAAVLAKIRVLECLKDRSCFDAQGVGAGGDVTKRFDFLAEQTMIEYLGKLRSFTLVSEEAGTQQVGRKPEGFVIMDPIDGSTNLSHNISFACISIAFATDLKFDSLEAAVVLDLFSRSCYHAMRGKGAYREHQQIRPAPAKALEDSLIGVDHWFPDKPMSKNALDSGKAPIRFTRHFGANALELCFVADGKLDAFVDLRGVFRGTDLAASFLILGEAGAVLIDPSGKSVSGPCTNDAKYAYIAARDSALAQELVALASGLTTNP
ncbi:MAG: inositol monophosphatase family protein [Candidatus Thorarchaeota archaeon]